MWTLYALHSVILRRWCMAASNIPENLEMCYTLYSIIRLYITVKRQSAENQMLFILIQKKRINTKVSSQRKRLQMLFIWILIQQQAFTKSLYPKACLWILPGPKQLLCKLVCGISAGLIMYLFAFTSLHLHKQRQNVAYLYWTFIIWHFLLPDECRRHQMNTRNI